MKSLAFSAPAPCERVNARLLYATLAPWADRQGSPLICVWDAKKRIVDFSGPVAA